MKVGAVRSAKFRLLKMRLGLPEWQVVGILQSLWLFASSSAIHGDIGRYADDEIAAALDMDAAMFSQVLAALIETRWVDEDLERRLVIHDWRDHWEQWVKRAAEKKEWVPSCYQKGGLASSKLAKASLGIAEDSYPILSSPCLAHPIQDPPNPPRGGTGAAGKPAKTPKVQPDIPTALDTAAFREAWATWIEHRREIRKPATPRAMKQQLVNLEAIGHDRAIAAIKHSVGNGWAGIFEAGPSSGAGRTGGGDRLGRVEAPPGKYDKYDLAMQKLQADRLAAKSQRDGGQADNGAVH